MLKYENGIRLCDDENHKLVSSQLTLSSTEGSSKAQCLEQTTLRGTHQRDTLPLTTDVKQRAYHFPACIRSKPSAIFSKGKV